MSFFTASKPQRARCSNSCDIKLVVVGDAFVGKTTLIRSYAKNQFPENYGATTLECCSANVNIDGACYALNVFDTAGQEDYAHLRNLSYPNTDVFLLCFSLVERNSLYNAVDAWAVDLRCHSPTVPVILVGMKSDLCENEVQKNIVHVEEAKKVAMEIGALRYLECSALTHKGMKRVFDEAMLVALGRLQRQDCLRRSKPKTGCLQLLSCFGCDGE